MTQSKNKKIQTIDAESIRAITFEKLKKPKGEKSVVMYIRTSAVISQWMKDLSISPTKLFNEAATILMEKSKTRGAK